MCDRESHRRFQNEFGNFRIGGQQEAMKLADLRFYQDYFSVVRRELNAQPIWYLECTRMRSAELEAEISRRYGDERDRKTRRLAVACDCSIRSERAWNCRDAILRYAVFQASPLHIIPTIANVIAANGRFRFTVAIASGNRIAVSDTARNTDTRNGSHASAVIIFLQKQITAVDRRVSKGIDSREKSHEEATFETISTPKNRQFQRQLGPLKF